MIKKKTLKNVVFKKEKNQGVVFFYLNIKR